MALARGKDVDTVVISASWPGFATRGDYYRIGDDPNRVLNLLTPETQWVMDGFEASLKELTAAGKQVVIVLSGPRGSMFDPRAMVVRNGLDFDLDVSPPVPRSRVKAMNDFVDQPLREIAARVDATVIDPVDLLCSPTTCPTTDDQGNPLFKDDSHLRTSVVRRGFDALDRYVFLAPQTDSRP